MSNIPFIAYDPKHKFISCTLHKYALLPNAVRNHFNDYHRKDTSPAERASIQHKVYQLAVDHAIQSSYKDFVTTHKGKVNVLPGLKLHQHCHQCRQCQFITSGSTAEKNMKTHLREQHNMRGSKKPQGEQWYEPLTRVVNAQQYFAAVPSQYTDLGVTSFFAVKDTDKQPNAPPDVERDRSTSLPPSESHHSSSTQEGQRGTTALADLQAQIDSAVQWAKEDQSKRLDAVVTAPGIHTDPWLVHTRFLQVLSVFKSWKDAAAMVAVPQVPEEPALHFLYCVAKSMVRTWQNTTAQTSRHVRIAVMQEHPYEIPLHPLAVYQNFDLRHAICLQKVFMFFARASDDTAANTLNLHLSPVQRQTWSRIQLYLDENAGNLPLVTANHARTTLSPPEKLCHDFWLSLVEQTTRTDDLELTILLPIAILSLNTAGTGFREVYNFATDLSALKKLNRFAAVQFYQERYASQGGEEQPPDARDDGPLSIEEAQQFWEREEHERLHAVAEDENRKLVDQFEHWIHNYLTCKYPTTMSWLISTARFASRFRYGENLDAFVHWSGDNVTVRSVRTSLPQLQSAVWNEYSVALERLQSLCFVDEQGDLPAVPWDTLEEQASRPIPGYSAFSDKSPQLSSCKGFVAGRLLEAARNGTHKEHAITDLSNLTQITRYGDLVQEFLGHLLCLVHLTSGQPARGTELLSIQHENTVANGLRNVFLFEGLVAIVPRYHKGYNRDKTLKTVYRFLPREIGSLVAWYLWLVRPFYILLQHQPTSSHQDRHYKLATSSFLWPDAHGNQQTTSRSLSKVVVRATMRWMGQEINLSTLRHLLIAFDRKVNNVGGVRELTKEEVDDVIDEAEAEAREMQAGHSPETGHNVYALDISQVFAQKQKLAHAHFKISCRWHRALGFHVPTGTAKTVDAALQQKQQDRTGMSVLALLRENLGPQAQFRGLQRQALEAVMSGETTVAYIAGTGSGKSLLFLLPACFPDYGQTIVVVPLAALRTDILARCKSLQIRATVWMKGQCDETASIILVTPESMAQDTFVHFARRIGSAGQLERIVVDEFHYVLNSNASYRPNLKNLQSIAKYASRVTLLSATIPYAEERHAYQMMGFGDTVTTFREVTVRSNVHYQVHTLAGHKPVTHLDMAEYVRTQQAELRKILVYVDKRTTAEMLAHQLQCGLVHGDMSDAEKASQQAGFANLDSGVLVATSAFSAGVHMDDLPAVFRFGKPDSLISWMQESGRAGRDGSPCTARLILSPGIPNTHYNNADEQTKAILSRFIQDNKASRACRRRSLDVYFDNSSGRRSCRQDEATCDVCSERSQTSLDDSVPVGSQPVTPVPSTPILADSVNSQRMATTDASTRSAPVRSPTPMASPAAGSLSAHRHALRLPQSHPQQVDRPTKRPSSALGPDDSVTDQGFPIAKYRAARQLRQIEFNVQQQGSRKAEQAELFMHKLPATQDYWSSHCVACFVECAPYTHSKAQCGTTNDGPTRYVGQLVLSYRAAMGNQWGRGQCWSCLMPCNCCPKWNIDGTGKARTQKQDHVPCKDKFAIRDTWACLWESCPKVRAKWIQWVRENPEPRDSSRKDWSQWTPGSDNTDLRPQFAQYFSSVVDYGDDFKAGRIVLALNWLTHTFFLHKDEEAADELLG